jgi:hypothetical protein
MDDPIGSGGDGYRHGPGEVVAKLRCDEPRNGGNTESKHDDVKEDEEDRDVGDLVTNVGTLLEGNVEVVVPSRFCLTVSIMVIERQMEMKNMPPKLAMSNILRPTFSMRNMETMHVIKRVKPRPMVQFIAPLCVYSNPSIKTVEKIIILKDIED